MSYYPNYEPPRDKIAPSVPFWKSGGGIALIVVGGVALIIGLILMVCCGFPMLAAVVSTNITPTPTP